MLLGKGVTAAPDLRGQGHRQLRRAASNDIASVQGEEMLKSDSWVEAQLMGSTEDQPSPTKLQTQTQPTRPLPSLPTAMNSSTSALRCRLAKEADPAQRNPPRRPPTPQPNPHTVFRATTQRSQLHRASEPTPLTQCSAGINLGSLEPG